MRIRVLMTGDDPTILLADSQLMRDKGLLVYTCFNVDNIDTLIEEIHPNVIFINPQKNDSIVTEAYNRLLGNPDFTHIPIIYTLAEDDVYLVTRKRMLAKGKRSLLADNITGAIKLALHAQSRSYARNNPAKQAQTMVLPPFIARA